MRKGLSQFRPFDGPNRPLLQSFWEILHDAAGGLWPDARSQIHRHPRCAPISTTRVLAPCSGRRLPVPPGPVPRSRPAGFKSQIIIIIIIIIIINIIIIIF
jgi:hypothetical protein